MADGNPPKKRSCLRSIILFVKVFTVLTVIALIAIGGGMLGMLWERRTSQAETERAAKLDTRVAELSQTVTDLEKQNGDLLSENQELKDSLKTEAEKQEALRKVTFSVKEVGKRLQAVEIVKPKAYFEVDKSYGTVTVESRPAEFSKDVKASGIQIRFAKSAVTVDIEPWGISGRALEQVESTKTTTADGKEALIQVLKDTAGKFTVQGTVVKAGTEQDNVKLLILAPATADNRSNIVDEVRSILRSTELNFADL